MHIADALGVEPSKKSVLKRGTVVRCGKGTVFSFNHLVITRLTPKVLVPGLNEREISAQVLRGNRSYDWGYLMVDPKANKVVPYGFTHLLQGALGRPIAAISAAHFRDYDDLLMDLDDEFLNRAVAEAEDGNHDVILADTSRIADRAARQAAKDKFLQTIEHRSISQHNLQPAQSAP